jgi:hypothetical protein
MNDTEKLAAIDDIIHDRTTSGNVPTHPIVAPPTEAVVWYKDTSSPVPTEILTDLTNVTELKRYCAHGLKANLKRGVAESDWQTYLGYADGVYAAQSPQEADAVVMGAGKYDQDTAVELILLGGTQGGGLGQPLSTFAPKPGMNFSEVAAWLVGVPSDAFGPSGE